MKRNEKIVAGILAIVLVGWAGIWIYNSQLFAVTTYEEFTSICRNTGGQIHKPLLIPAPPILLLNPDINQDMTICSCQGFGGMSYEDVKYQNWKGCD